MKNENKEWLNLRDTSEEFGFRTPILAKWRVKSLIIEKNNKFKKWLFISSIVIMIVLFLGAIGFAFFTMALNYGELSYVTGVVTMVLFAVPLKLHRALMRYVH